MLSHIAPECHAFVVFPLCNAIAPPSDRAFCWTKYLLRNKVAFFPQARDLHKKHSIVLQHGICVRHIGSAVLETKKNNRSGSMLVMVVTMGLSCQERAQEISAEAILCKYSRHTATERTWVNYKHAKSRPNL